MAASWVSDELVDHFSSIGSTTDSSLLLQPFWDQITYYGMPYIENRAFFSIPALVVHIITCMFFSWLDLTGRHYWKIDKRWAPTLNLILGMAIPQCSLFIFGSMMSWVGWYYAPSFFRETIPMEAPTVGQFLMEVTFGLVIGDALIFVYHWSCHLSPFLRKHFHEQHHTWSVAWSWAGTDITIIEGLSVVLCQMIPIWGLGVHPLSAWTHICLWTYNLDEEHSDYDVPWSIEYLLPGIGAGARTHCVHHFHPQSNYGFIFCVWDKMMGTFVPPEKVKNPFVPPYKTQLIRHQKSSSGGQLSSTSSGTGTLINGKRTKSPPKITPRRFFWWSS